MVFFKFFSECVHGDAFSHFDELSETRDGFLQVAIRPMAVAQVEMVFSLVFSGTEQSLVFLYGLFCFLTRQQCPCQGALGVRVVRSLIVEFEEQRSGFLGFAVLDKCDGEIERMVVVVWGEAGELFIAFLCLAVTSAYG